MSLVNLPAETLSLILEFLAEKDLASLLLAQRVCRRFQDAIERILTRHHNINCAAPSSFIRHQFHILFDTENKPTFFASTGARKLSDLGIVFSSLPWVADRRRNGEHAEVRNGDMKAAPHLRPEASWRRLSAAWGLGGLDVKSLDVVKVLSTYGGTRCKYAQLDIPPGPRGDEGVLTMGLLYDLLASGLGHLGRMTRGWRLMRGRRLRSYDDWLLLRRSSVHLSQECIMHLFVEDEDSAVLFVTGLKGCKGVSRLARIESEDPDECIWEPSAIGGVPVVLCP
ncbi:hypothetical protein F5Y05DRAFT_147857 [Hypoxylon sp. FL0543]|nr:hypothetical protein F5Y05DRAFT_147857 [Hypoxylon sp. FL0543]